MIAESPNYQSICNLERRSYVHNRTVAGFRPTLIRRAARHLLPSGEGLSGSLRLPCWFPFLPREVVRG